MREKARLPHDETPVGAQDLTGHRGGCIGGQVGDGGRSVVRCEPPLERLAVDCRVELFVRVDGTGARGVG
jgi:hypothetical protein